MSTILAIETSSELASVALLIDGRVFTKEVHGTQTHSQTVLPMIQQLLAECGKGIGQCDALAFGSGPGSFTGVRTACGIVQGLAYGTDLPAIPIITLEAMAHSCRQRNDADDVVVILDARMGEVYWAQYHYMGGWQVIVPPTLSMPEAVLPHTQAVACGNGLMIYQDKFPASLFSQIERSSALLPHAIQIAELAQSRLESGSTIRAHEVQPFYLRNKVALTTAERTLQA